MDGEVHRRHFGASAAARKDDGNASARDPHEIWYRFGGKLVGHVGSNGTLDTDYASLIATRTATQGAGAFRATTHTQYADFDQSLAPINSYTQGASGGVYTVDGDGHHSWWIMRPRSRRI